MMQILLALMAMFALSTNPSHSDQTIAEVVQSIPDELPIAQPGVKNAKDLWPEMIDSARSSIELAQMYVSQIGATPGQSPLDATFAALERAGARGVKIRVILSKNMITNDVPSVDRLKKIPNLELRVIDFKNLTGGILHAKYWIIDRSKIFIGSQNTDWKALTQIHELGEYVQEPSLAMQLLSVFETDWEIALTGKAPQKLPTAPASAVQDIELVASPAQFNPKGIRYSLDALKELIRGAKDSIRIQVMDYSTFSGNQTWKDIDDELRAAGKRGVKVDLLVSHWNQEKPEIDSLKALVGAENVDVRICTIPMLSTGFMSYARVIHSKYMLVDGKIMWLGTSNWSKGYFAATRGVELINRRPEMTDLGNRIFNTLWTANYTEKVDPNKEYPLPRKGN